MSGDGFGKSAGESAGSGEALDRLAYGMHRVAQGNFDTELERPSDAPMRDIVDDFNRMAESLLQVESLRESFVSNVAHEFKTPLSYIQGYATLLQDDDLPHEKRREYVEHINKATRRLSDMIGNLLEISNLSRPNAHLTTSRFSLDEQLRHVVAVFVPQMERKRVAFELDLVELDINANESLLEDAWTNLVSNAVKYTPAGGTVSVALERHYRDAVVTVTDTGCGMSAGQLEHAFDRFYQGEEAHKAEGSGLGLAIVKAVVKKHDGLMRAESEPGRGSKFVVTLPLDRRKAF